MKLKESLFNLFLGISSVAIGIFICELSTRSLGLGNPILYNSDSLVGYRLKPNQSKKRRKGAIVTTDSEGFRFDPTQTKLLTSEIIVFVGDSVTYGGSYIDDSELFSSYYCSNNENLNCLNSGLNAWGTYNMGRFISNFSIYSKRKPSKFLIVILPGDESRNIMSLSSQPFWEYPPKHPKAINEILNYIFWRFIIPGLRDTSEYKENHQDDFIVKSTQIDLAWKDLNNSISSSESKVEIFVTPPRRWFEDSKLNSSEIKKYDQYIDLISKNIKVAKACNLYYLIKEEYSPKYYVDNVHLSKLGHKKWAKYIKSCNTNNESKN